MKLKRTEIRPYRLEQLQAQGCLCALCGELIVDDAVLDHDHKTGEIRGVLHRGCNALLGKVENNMPRNQVNLERLAKFAENLIKYLTDDAKSELLHPTYKSPEERKMAYKKKRKKK